MTEDKPVIYYKKDCFNEPYCSLGKVIEQLDQLKAENEKLKKELSTYGATGICETCTEKSVSKCDQLEKEKVWLQRELIQYEKDVKDLSYFATKLKQTLLEIKEIAKPFCNTCQEFELEKSGGCIYCNYGKILQKIREVEGCLKK